jgi:hypothetical protein
MADHAKEKHWIEPRERTAKPSDEAPVESKVEIAGIMDLASLTVPSIREYRVTSLGLDMARILDSLPWELRKGVTIDKGATFLRSKSILLRVCGIPDPVYEKITNEQSGHDIWVMAICSRVVVGQVDCAMAVTQWDTSQIPED